MIAWTYHVPVPPDVAAVNYVDVRVDHSRFDYEAVLRHWAWAADRWSDGHVICRDSADPASPMYQRVVAMHEAVSFDLSQPIAFLDSDAFLNADIRPIFDGDWDIGVTYRHDFEMRLNEGVIFVNNRRPDAVRSFFAAYLATYDRLCGDAATLAKYSGNIKRWRGGQLALNALACPQGLPSALDRLEIAGAIVTYWPCWCWNFSVDRVDPKELDTKAVLHLKGGRKALLDNVARYQNDRA